MPEGLWEQKSAFEFPNLSSPHPTNKNEIIVWDLAQDPRQLAGLDVEAVRRRMFGRRMFAKQSELDAAGQGETRLPIKTIHINKSPIVIGNLKTLGDAADRWGLDVSLALLHAEHAATLGAQLQHLWAPVFQRPAPGETPDVDEAFTAASSATTTAAHCSVCWR